MASRQDLPGTLVTVAGALVALVAGVAAAQRGTMAILLLAGLCALALALVFNGLGFGTVLTWIALTAPLYPLLNTEATNSPISFDRLMIAGMASWLVLNRQKTDWPKPTRNLAYALLWLLVAFGVRAALTEQVGEVPLTEGDARRGALNIWIDAILLPVVLFFVVATQAVTLQRCLRIAGALSLAGAVVGAIAIAEKLAGFSLADESGGHARVDAAVDVVRTSGPYPVPEVFAVVLLVCLAATVWWTLAHGGNAVIWGIAAISLELGGLAVSLFRAAWLGAIIILIAGIGLRPGRALRVVVVVLAAGAVLAVGYAELRANRVFEARLENTQNIKGRLATYKQSLKIFRTEPVTGVGVGQFRNAQGLVPVTVVGGEEAVSSPHSSFLGLLAEQGVVGILPLIACLLAIVQVASALRRRSREPEDSILWGCLIGATLAYLVMSLTLTMLPYGPSNAFFAVMLGIAAARVNAVYGSSKSAAV